MKLVLNFCGAFQPARPPGAASSLKIGVSYHSELLTNHRLQRLLASSSSGPFGFWKTYVIPAR